VRKNGECAQCHDAPPSSGAHAAHLQAALGCNDCHPGTNSAGTVTNPVFHANSLVDVVIDSFSTTWASAKYNSASRTCSNVSCHTPSITSGASAISWDSTGLGCSACHGIPPADASHSKHVGAAGIDCGQCHSGYRLRDSLINQANHLNRITNVDDKIAGGTYSAADSSCTRTYCHGAFSGGDSAEVAWNRTSVRCGSCHGLAPNKGAHLAHLQNGVVCNDCHSGYSAIDSTVNKAQHVNMVVNVNSTLSGGMYSPAATTCTNISCHGSGSSTVNWYDTTLFCGACHLLPPKTGSHEFHVTTKGTDCTICHSGFSITDSSVSVLHHKNGTTEVDGVIDGGTYTRSDSSCSNVGCHGSASAVNWFTGSFNCGTCHGIPPDSGAHRVHSTNNHINCKECHLGYDQTDSTISTAHHQNNITNVDGPIKGGTFTTAGKVCNNVYCHGSFAGGTSAAPSWNGSVACGSCHVIPPVSGTHTVHVTERNYNCNVCHNGYNSTNSSTHATHHVDSIRQVDGTLGSTLRAGAGGTYNSTTKSCANTYCHGNFTNGTNDTPVWATTENCGSCHTMTPSSGKHRTHRSEGYGCTTCHNGYTANTSVNWTTHVNGSVQVKLNVSGTYNPAGQGSCSGLPGACHGSESWR